EDSRSLDPTAITVSAGALEMLRWFEADQARQFADHEQVLQQGARDRRTAEALRDAERRTRALGNSGAIHLAARLTTLRSPMSSDPATGVRGAIDRIGDDLAQLRADVSGDTAAGGGVEGSALATDWPPPLQVQRAHRAEAR